MRRNRSGSDQPRASSSTTGMPSSASTTLATARRDSTESCSRAPVDRPSNGTGRPPTDRETIDRSGATSTAKPSGWSTDPSSSSASRKGCT